MNVEVRRMETAAEKAAASQFEARSERLPGAAWVRELRDAAIARFAEEGLPHRRVEEWKYTDLRAAMRTLPEPAAADGAEAAPRTLAGVDAWRIVVVDGGRPQIPDGLAALDVLEVRTLADALAEGDTDIRSLMADWPEGTDSAVFDLNSAFMSDGVVLRVRKGATLDKPVHVAFVTTGGEASTAYVRNVVVVEDDARAMFVESYEGPDGLAYQVNSATRAVVGDRADFTWLKVQRDGDEATHLSTFGAEIGAQTEFVCAPIVIGSALTRNNVAFRFDGEESNGRFAGVHMLAGRQHIDTTMFVDHKVPGCVSRELVKTVADGRSRSVFQGKIIVRQEAQKTDGKMMSQALMLSDGIEVDNKPELEIYADDVQCGHGATAGQLDRDLLFYLRARGIPRAQAEALLIEAFIGEAVDVIGDESIREALSAYVHTWVAARKDIEA